ncbi:MAG: type IX secretion system membrane protein PorP/SprF [Flavobacteriaceae bacterium]|nr:type IX secretion system membrane protein PorP/SprF [Flavobacteriaceae bacterium]
MKNSIIISAFLLLIMSSQIQAQQDPYYMLYKYNMNIVNPAYAGSSNFSELSTGFRMQWVGVEDAPKTQFLSYSAPLKRNLGIGLSVVNDEVFVLKETDITLDLSYHIKLNEDYLLYFGLKGGGSFITIDLTRANVQNDPLFTENQSFFNPTMGAGLYLKNEKFYLTLSTPNFLSGERYEKEGNVPVAATDELHLYVGGGYNLELTEKITFMPSIMMRYIDGVENAYDLAGTFDFNQKVQAGINVRLNEAIAIFAMTKVIDQMQFGVAYEKSTEQSRDYTGTGTFEALLRFRFL